MEQIKSLNIFLVDDDPFYLNIFEQFLINLGVEKIQSFTQGHECINNIEERPDIVFLDHNMGDLEGGEVLNKIKRYDPNIYVVMVSGQENIQTAVELLKKGAFDYIQKGNNEDEQLKDVILKIVKVKEILARQSSGKPSFFKRINSFLSLA